MQALFFAFKWLWRQCVGTFIGLKQTVNILAVLVGSILIIACVLTPALADEYLCDATQASPSDLPLLKGDCPIGEGLWGGRGPSENAELYWVQCGVLHKPLSLIQVKEVYKFISTDVWMIRYAKAYRCLIGPYDDYAMALKEWRQVRKIPRYRDVFIRELRTQPSFTASSSQVESSYSQSITVISPDSTKTHTKALIPPPTQTPETIISPVEQSTASKAAGMDILVRRQAKLGNKSYAVPFVRDYEHFYMEYNKPWNRMDYDAAIEVCGLLGMRLATQTEWKSILESGELSREKWPLHLPYWGQGQRGLFTSGKITPLKGSSLLNVLCFEP